MKKKIAKIIGLIIFIVLVALAICNIYTWIVSGKQDIKISTSTKAYTDSNLYVSVIAQKNGLDLDTKTELKLLDSNEKVVQNVNITYDQNNAILGIPKIDPGKYYLEAKVSSEAGKDTVKKEIYLSNGNSENITISLDKGIYKPGDTVNFRALITNKDNDIPQSDEVSIIIYDGNDNKVYNEKAKASDYGIISGKFSLANEVNSGLYKLVIKTPSQETTKQFKVNPYVTPKYELKVNYDKDSYLINDTAKIKVNAHYFFGEPVSNAKLTVYIDGKEFKTLYTNSEGIAELDYKIKDPKNYNLKIEAVDSSNYYVEETSNFVAGTDIFEIQFLPEYGDLINSKKNNIYVFTNKADGTPLKTYITISSNNFTKQVATDENGIGKFSIDVENVSNSEYRADKNGLFRVKTKVFGVKAQDMDGNIVQKNIFLDIENKNLLFSTNKVKYEQGENINLNIESLNDIQKNIYFLKNDKLIKMISTNSKEAVVNLDDNYGLIDIIISENHGNNYYNYKDNYYYKRTIFIKPSKSLSVQISTDKHNYAPGEKMSISFNTLDENRQNVDAALLVSMLDNSILNLANNDLSIDNIKLSLQDIVFSDDLDAATLYSCIVNDSSEQSIMGLLLKQSDKNLNISETKIRNTEQERKATEISVILIILIAIIIITALCAKFAKFRLFAKHALNYIMLNFIVSQLVFCIINEHFWRNGFTISMFIAIVIITLAIYIALLSKIGLKLFKSSLYIILGAFVYIIFTLLIKALHASPNAVLITLSSIILIGVIISKISNRYNWKINKYIKKISKELLHIIVFSIAFIISLFVGHLVEEFSDISDIQIPICLICVYLLDYLINKWFYKNNDKESQNIDKIKKSISHYVSIVLEIIGAILICFLVITSLIYVIPWNRKNDMLIREHRVIDDGIDFEINNSGQSNLFDRSLESADLASSSSSSDESVKKSGSSIFNGLGDLFSLADNTSKEAKEETNNYPTNEPKKESKSETTVDNKVRNIFLESMCFIPELVTANGNANLDLNLSDNITTWTIQTVGNTKDGKIGYGSLNNVKVFKDFFVDFELPKNLVETDSVSIPVTIYNYTDDAISTKLEIAKADWFSFEKNNIEVKVDAKASKLVYIPIKVLKTGENKFRVEASGNSLTDIIEKQCTVSPKGQKIEKVVSTGTLDEDISEDILILDNIIDNTAKAKIKIYASNASQTVEGIEKIFRMPTGCFEQISSSLYPNILALKYLEEHGIVDEKLKQKALTYISSGYQKLLTYEVKGESGGYSLYGNSPAETVLTAYGLMEISDLANVYKVDESVIQKMTDFLYSKQNLNGSFTITGSHLGGANSRATDSLNAYITWGLSESNPKDNRLSKSVDYLKGKLDNIKDNYTLALIANILANVNDNRLNDVLKRLVNNINLDGNKAYLTTNIVDYYGSRGNVQTVQTVALASMALSKANYNTNTNKLFINYLINKKDVYGTWYSTQATILALKALNRYNQKNSIESQTIKVTVNSDVKELKIGNNPLEIYELTFENLSKENKLSIDMEKGNAYYEITEEYYIPYDEVNTDNDKISVDVKANTKLNVNDVLDVRLKLINESHTDIYNGMVTISIPQGFSVLEESLMELETKGLIEKYEYSYTGVNLYLRDFEANEYVDVIVKFRAGYPVNITGLAVTAYDYYNPEIQGKSLPLEITVE